MPFPVKVCVVCEEEFELRPGKPGFANRCMECSAEEPGAVRGTGKLDAEERKSLAEANQARRESIRNLLYRKDN